MCEALVAFGSPPAERSLCRAEALPAQVRHVCTHPPHPPAVLQHTITWRSALAVAPLASHAVQTLLCQLPQPLSKAPVSKTCKSVLAGSPKVLEALYMYVRATEGMIILLGTTEAVINSSMQQIAT